MISIFYLVEIYKNFRAYGNKSKGHLLVCNFLIKWGMGKCNKLSSENDRQCHGKSNRRPNWQRIQYQYALMVTI